MASEAKSSNTVEIFSYIARDQKSSVVKGEIKAIEERIVLELKPHLAPIKIAVIPLKRNEESIVEMSIALKKELQLAIEGKVILENTGNIGKNYRKHDEIGTPVCITIDFDTLNDRTVTVRNRDTMEQQRVDVQDLKDLLKDLIQQ